MPWFLIKVAHGPGHQSRSEKYVWSDNPRPSRETKREWFENFVDERHMNDPIGKVRKAKLPEKERQWKIKSAQAKKRDAEAMLKILRTDPKPKTKPKRGH